MLLNQLIVYIIFIKVQLYFMSIQQKIIFASQVFIDKIQWKKSLFAFKDKSINGFTHVAKGRKMHLFEKVTDSRFISIKQILHIYSKLYKKFVKISKDTFSNESTMKISNFIPIYLKTKQLLCFVQQNKCVWIVHIQQDTSNSQSNINIYKNEFLYFIEKIYQEQNILKYKCLIITPNDLSFTHNKLINKFIATFVQKIIMHIQDNQFQYQTIENQREQTQKSQINEKNSSYNEELHSRILKLKEQEKHIFYQMRKIFPQENDNTICRFLTARQFKLEKTVECLKEYIIWKKNMMTIEQQIFKDLMQKNYFLYLGKDHCGRPVVFYKACRVIPSELGDKELYVQFFNYYFEIFITSKMEGFVDQILVVGDLENLGMKHVDIQLANKIIHDMLKYSPQRQAKIIIINPNWIASFAWKMLKPLLPKRTIQKVNVITESENNFLLLKQQMDISIIPDYLGGTNKVSHKLI